MKIERVSGHEKSQTTPGNAKSISKKPSYKLAFHSMGIDAKMPQNYQTKLNSL